MDVLFEYPEVSVSCCLLFQNGNLNEFLTHIDDFHLSYLTKLIKDRRYSL